MRCVECGEVQWNLRTLAQNGDAPAGECRVCGAELRHERRRPGRRIARFVRERRDSQPSPGTEPGEVAT